ncbi:MAG: HlyD family efflux transporter periplasmic adaptor subunit [Phycisphaerales bacterium]|nr:HlyD family efflux transporter periplasmic adaptor subunit [Phycisphaerales bacterium]MCI0630785.1 HlyD family efflux transporter periplasmic adaptor subunit [Phycisphaerales bacterium]
MKQKSVRGQVGLLIVGLLVALGLSGVVALTMRRGASSNEAGGGSDIATARRGEFQISLPVSGELAAMNQIEIRNRLDTQAIITEIVAEGKWVNTGDVLLKLNDDELRNKVKDGIDEVNVAEAAAIAAASELDITIKERESELAKADLAIRLAELAWKSWEEGEDISKRKELALAVETARKNAERLRDRFKASAALLEKKYISLDEYKQDEIAMIEANAELDKAVLDVELYEKYQYEQDKAKKSSDLEQAKAERDRTQQSLDAKVRSAQSALDSKKYQLESKRERLRLQEQQLTYCTQVAPSPGLVVYTSSLDGGFRWGGDDGPPQVGTQIYPNQTVIVLPDTSKMVAAVKVSESLSGQIKVGQFATVTSDAIPDRVLEGEVQSVGVLAESGGWRDPNRRDYTVKILLYGIEDLGLKPAMRCKANIYVGRVEEALHIPVQAVFQSGSTAYVYVPQGTGYAQRKVTLGRSSELFTEVVEGLNEGDAILLREPEASEIVSRIELPKGRRGEGGPRGRRGGAPGGAEEKPEGAVEQPAETSSEEPTAAGTTTTPAPAEPSTPTVVAPSGE